MAYLWVTIVILLAIIEAMTIDIVTIWFVISGIFTIIFSFFVDNFFLQMGLFTILGVTLLITTRPLLKKLLKTKNEKTNYDRIIGMEGIVTEKITKNSIGEVKVDGKKWSAISDKTILEGSTVQIQEIIGVKIKVKQV